MSDNAPENRQLFDDAAIAEAESAQWVAIHLQETVRAISPVTPAHVLHQTLISRFQRYHRQRRLIRKGFIGSAGLGGLTLVADGIFDIEWLELLNSLIDWLAKPLVLKLAEAVQPYLDWLS